MVKVMVKETVNGKRKREVGLVVPGKYCAYLIPIKFRLPLIFAPQGGEN